jgi:hypothetical protein
MPTFSDPPYPFDCLPMESASAFECYQIVKLFKVLGVTS